MKKKLITYFAFLFFIVAASTIQAQTHVRGKVYDADTKEPLPFVNLIFKGTKTGTTTDFDGNYDILTELATDSIVASYIGYKRTAKKIKPGVAQNLDIYLSKEGIALLEVVVNPGENPAHRILRKVIANKPNNDKEKLESFEYEVYNKIEFDINDLDPETKNKKILKPIAFVFDYVDSTNKKEKPYLPVFISEAVSDYYYKRHPRSKKEVIRANKVSGIDNKSVAQFMGEMYQNVNIYDNNILVFSKNFISPISDNGLFFYRYYLIDSLVLDGHRCYHIQFKPKRKQELTFSGNMWIADTTFGVQRLEMSIAEDANINFVRTMNVIQEYTYVDSVWMLNKDRLVVDFKIQKKQSGFYGRKTTSYKDYVINKPRDDEFYPRNGDNLIVNDNATKQNEDFWNTARHDTLSKNERQIYKMVDTIQGLPVYKTWLDIVTLFATGYRVFNNIEFGPYYNTLSFNSVEGPRIRIGGRTSSKFSRWYELSGYMAYGFKDEKFKYNFGGKSFITKKPRQLVGMYYRNDYEILGQSQNAFTQDNILASLFRRSPLTNLTRVQQINAYYEMEWFSGFLTRVSFVNRDMTPLGIFKYEYYKPDQNIGYRSNLITSEVRLFARFAFDEKYIQGDFTRTSVGTKYPIIAAQLSLGIKDIFHSEYNFQKISANLSDRFRINPLGYTDYIIEYGRVFGPAPYPILELHGGNETYVYDPYAYNMMNYYEFVSDEYATLQVFHHFDGLFLNRIPLLRKLKWREVITGKVLIGRINSENKNVFIFPNRLYTLEKGPYYEASAGIENIFKIFRVDAVWRLAYLNNPNIAKFGIRAAMQFSF